jgi:hypothetical protein
MYGADAVRHSEFNDSFNAYLYLYARATTLLHLEQLVTWKNGLVGIADVIVDPTPAQTIKEAMEGDISDIASVV